MQKFKVILREKYGLFPMEFLTGALLIAAGMLLRLRQLAAFEFKDDQARTLINAICAVRDGFLVLHGQPGSNGFPNPPGAPILLGFGALFRQDAFFFAALFTVFSLLTVAAAYFLTRRGLGKQGAWWCAVLTAVMPALIFNASNLWGPNLLPLTVLGFCWLLDRYWRTGEERCWIAAGLLAGAGAWAWHLSAIFLLPAAAYVWFRRRTSWRAVLLLGAGGTAMFAPWLWYLAARWDRSLSHLPVTTGDKVWSWLHQWARFGNGWFFEEYYPHGELMSQFSAPWITALLLTAGALWLWCAWVVRLGHIRRLRRYEWLSLISIGAVLLCYLLLRVKMEYHYMMVLAIPLLALAACGTVQIPRKWRWLMPLCCGLLLLTVTGTLQSRVIAANGHYHEFGPSGNLLEKTAAELDRTGLRWNLRIVPMNERAGKKLDPIAGMVIFDRHMQSDGKPGLLLVDYTDADGFFCRIAEVK